VRTSRRAGGWVGGGLRTRRVVFARRPHARVPFRIYQSSHAGKTALTHGIWGFLANWLKLLKSRIRALPALNDAVKSAGQCAGLCANI
jgi:hypothetical protein